MEKKEAEKAWNEIADFMNRNNETFEYIFIPQSTYKEDDDRKTAEKLIARLNTKTSYKLITNRYDPRELIGFYRICDVTLAIRLHAAVFSTIAATPVIAINYLPKVEGFMKSVKMDEFLIPVNDISQITMQKKLNQIEANHEKYKLLLNTIMSELRIKVEHYSHEALKILTN